MYKIIGLSIPFIIGGILNGITTRSYNSQALGLKLYPGIFINVMKIICSSLFSKKKNNVLFGQIFLLATLYEINTFIDAFFAYKVKGIFYAIAVSSKFIFVAFLSFFMLKRRFTFLEKLGLTTICAVVFYGAYNTTNKNESSDDMNACLNFIVVVFSGFLSSLCNVYFDKYIKKNIRDFYTHILDYSKISILLSMITANCEILLCEDSNRVFMTLVNLKFYLYVFLSVAHAYFGAYIALKTEPIARSFLSLLMSNIASIVIEYIEDKKISNKSLISLLIVNLGILLYEIRRITIYLQKIIKKDKHIDS